MTVTYAHIYTREYLHEQSHTLPGEEDDKKRKQKRAHRKKNGRGMAVREAKHVIEIGNRGPLGLRVSTQPAAQLKEQVSLGCNAEEKGKTKTMTKKTHSRSGSLASSGSLVLLPFSAVGGAVLSWVFLKSTI